MEEPHPLDRDGSKVIEVPREDEGNTRHESSRLRRLIVGAVCVVFLLVWPAVGLTMLILPMDPQLRNLVLGGTAALLVFVFLFGDLIVRSYNRDKEKMMKQNPYRDDHIIQ